MIALIVGVVVLAAAVAAWARLERGRSERHSVQSYEHVLDVLGDVSRRGESAAPVHPLSGEGLARPHVGPSEGGTVPRPDAAEAVVPPPRLRLHPPSRISSGLDRVPDIEAGEEADQGAEAAEVAALRSDPPEVVIAFDDLPEPIEIGSVSGRAKRAMRRGRDNFARRVATGAAAAVVLGALGVGGWQLASTGGGHPSVAAPPAHQNHPKKGQHTPAPSTPPTSLDPVSTTSSLVTYDVPSATFTVSFKATAACWLGIRGTTTSSPYLWMDTLSTGGAAVYPADGQVQDPILVRIGAPQALSISVNGIPVTLPSGLVRPYYIALTPQAALST